MIPRKRTPFSATQRAEVWRRWKAGESLHAIGRAVGKDHVVVHLLLRRHGGIAPTSPRRSRRVLALAEREDISRGIASGCSLRTIAQQVRRAPSTVSREVARHGGRARSIELAVPTPRPGSRHCGPNRVGWPPIAS